MLTRDGGAVPGDVSRLAALVALGGRVSNGAVARLKEKRERKKNSFKKKKRKRKREKLTMCPV